MYVTFEISSQEQRILKQSVNIELVIYRLLYFDTTQPKTFHLS